MVKGAEDGTYKGLKERFDALAGVFDPINEVLDTWEKNGIEQAMSLYFKSNAD